MSAEVIATTNFRREAKMLIKKYYSLRNELLEFDAILDNDLKRLTKERNQ